MITTPTLMRREIDEIPDVLERILASPDVRRVAAAITDARPRWIAIAARGTSNHAAVYAGYLLETHLGIPTGLAKPSALAGLERDVARETIGHDDLRCQRRLERRPRPRHLPVRPQPGHRLGRDRGAGIRRPHRRDHQRLVIAARR